MTDTERIELRKLLATKVMGWQPVEAAFGWYYDDYLPVGEWKPDLDIAQAFMVAEKIGQLRLAQDPMMSWMATFRDAKPDLKSDTPSLAICLAAREWAQRRAQSATPNQPSD